MRDNWTPPTPFLKTAESAQPTDSIDGPPAPAAVETKSAGPKVFLDILRGNASQASRPMRGATLVLGSDRQSDIQLRSPDVASRHCLVSRGDDHVLITRLNPSFPIYLDGEPVVEALVEDGSVLGVGPFQLRFRIEGLLPKPQPPKLPPPVAAPIEAASGHSEQDRLRRTRSRVVDRYRRRVAQLGHLLQAAEDRTQVAIAEGHALAELRQTLQAELSRLSETLHAAEKLRNAWEAERAAQRQSSDELETSRRSLAAERAELARLAEMLLEQAAEINAMRASSSGQLDELAERVERLESRPIPAAEPVAEVTSHEAVPSLPSPPLPLVGPSPEVPGPAWPSLRVMPSTTMLRATTLPKFGSESSQPADRIPTEDIRNGVHTVDDEELVHRIVAVGLLERADLEGVQQSAKERRLELREELLASGMLTAYEMTCLLDGRLGDLGIGPAKILDLPYCGPLATLYRVLWPGRPRPCVLKLYDAKWTRIESHWLSFDTAFRPLLRFRHPHVVATLDLVRIEDRFGLLQEEAAGWTLDRLWNHPEVLGPAVPVGALIRYCQEAVTAIVAAQRAGITHRALRPGRLVIHPDLGLRVLGFGEPSWLRRLARCEARREDLDCIAPEELANQPSDLRADLYSLGQIFTRWIHTLPIVEPLPPAFAELLRALGQPDPADRPADPATVLALLDSLAESPHAPPRWPSLPADSIPLVNPHLRPVA